MTIYSAFRNPHITWWITHNLDLPKISIFRKMSDLTFLWSFGVLWFHWKIWSSNLQTFPKYGWKLKIFVFHPPSVHWISDCLILMWWLHDISSPYNWNDLWKCMSFYKWGYSPSLIIENIQLQKNPVALNIENFWSSMCLISPWVSPQTWRNTSSQRKGQVCDTVHAWKTARDLYTTREKRTA